MMVSFEDAREADLNTPSALAALFALVRKVNQQLASGAGSIKDRKSLEARLRGVEDREEIRRLLFDYGRFLDRRDFAAFSQLFARDDGEWIGGMGKAKGRRAIQKLMEGSIGTQSGAADFHLFIDPVIDVSGDRAAASTNWIFVVPGGDNRPQLVYLGRYEDSLIREGGRWKFLRRVVHMDIPPEAEVRKPRADRLKP